MRPYAIGQGRGVIRGGDGTAGPNQIQPRQIDPNAYKGNNTLGPLSDQLMNKRVKASTDAASANYDQEPPQWVTTLTSFLNTASEKIQEKADENAAQGELMATAPIQITVTDADGTVKDIQNIKTRIGLVEKNQSASTAGAPPLV